MNQTSDKKGSILIVEDNEIDRTVVKVMLQKLFHIDCAQNGQEALRFAEDKVYDIILMDIDLGDKELDGIKVMKRIREDRKHDATRIFAVTAYDENREWFVEQGFDDLYSKPVIKEEMIEALNSSKPRNLLSR